MVVEVTADHNRGVGVLSEDVPDYLKDPQRPVLVVEALTILQVEVEDLYLDVTGGQPGPAEVVAQSLY